MWKRELICIGCPMGCNLTVTSDKDIPESSELVPSEFKDSLTITGNTCPKGDDYARKEVTDPRRVVTSTVRVKGGNLPEVSVKTAGDIPKGRIMDCMKSLKDVELEAPVTIGQVILRNVCDTGVDIVATKNIHPVVSNN